MYVPIELINRGLPSHPPTLCITSGKYNIDDQLSNPELESDGKTGVRDFEFSSLVYYQPYNLQG